MESVSYMFLGKMLILICSDQNLIPAVSMAD
jgi:hypothetical protein